MSWAFLLLFPSNQPGKGTLEYQCRYQEIAPTLAIPPHRPRIRRAGRFREPRGKESSGSDEVGISGPILSKSPQMKGHVLSPRGQEANVTPRTDSPDRKRARSG